MSTDTILVIKSTSSNATEQLGQLVGQNLRGGEVLELKSDLGGGKTTFTRGLTQGMGSSDHVASPSFTIAREYHSPKLTLKHLDFHRLDDAGIVKHELAEAINDPSTVVAIEWANTVRDILPKERLIITIKTIGENKREIQINCPKLLNYLLKDIKNVNPNN